VLTLQADPPMWEGALYPEEEVFIIRAVTKRRREFTAGRLCARRALSLLGIENYPLLAGQDRLPVWPPGIVGSLSHCNDYCGVAVARRDEIASVGFDVERAGPLKSPVIRMICTETESAWAEKTAPRTGVDWHKVIFSAKESTYKCYYPLARRMLNFHDVEVSIDPEKKTFSARLLRGTDGIGGAGGHGGLDLLRGRFAFDERYVVTGVTLTAAELQASFSSPHRSRGDSTGP
jgi:4'-phosphopantetheinyl transferase EntD